MLRDPVNRTYSYYRHIAPIDNYYKSFEAFLDDYPEVVKQSFYSNFIKRYFQFFGQEQFLIIIYEKAMMNIPQTIKRIAQFLEIKENRFSPSAGQRVVNQSRVPRFRKAYALASSINRYLRRSDFDPVVNFAKKLRIEGLFGSGDPLPPMEPETREFLKNLFSNDIKEIEELLGIDLDCWTIESG